MTKSPLTLLTLSLVTLAACAEAAAPRDASGARDAALADDAATTATPDAGVITASVVVNELAPDGEPDFVELYNPGSVPLGLAGAELADADGLTDPPDATHRITFPSGTTIPAGGYLVVAMNVDPPSGETETPVGPVTPCPIDGVASCLQAAFGIGRTSETIAVLASDGTELARADYEGDLMGAEQSSCRLPDGTGAFTTCAATPGAANAALP